jgi:hypothetical protein
MKQQNFISTRIIALFFLVPFVFTSCRLYHLKTRTVMYNNAQKIVQQNAYPYILVHVGDSYWQLKNPKVKNETISGELTKVDERVDYYYRKGLERTNFTIQQSETIYAYQLHLFVDALETDKMYVTIPYTSITDLKVLDKNRGLSAVGNLLIAGTTAAAGIGIFLLIACSCPHNYTFDGEQYHYNNTLFTGATAPNLERHDFKSLPDYHPENSTYKMLVKNEENEIQYTNLMEMISVSHAKEVEVATDQSGNVYTLKKREKAIYATSDNGADLTAQLNQSDDQAYSFDQVGDDDFSHVFARFHVDTNNENAKLIVRAKNSNWGGLVYHSFAQLMGKNYSKWVKHNQKRTTEEAQKDVIEAGIPLLIEVKKNGNWVPIEAINLISEVNYNELIVPIATEFLSDETIEFRLSSGYKFWEIDALQMDFSLPESVSIERFAPSSAVGNEDYTMSLSKDDDNYMEHHTTGDSALVVFENLPVSSQKRTLFLHSKGYYLSNDSYEGGTKWGTMLALREKGGLSAFSKVLYEAYMNRASIE